MKCLFSILGWPLYLLLSFATLSCNEANPSPSKQEINQLNLKRGEIITCGPKDLQFGLVDFNITCNKNVVDDFNFAISLLHSFEYDESEKAFANVISKDPGCAMAYWGVAMSNFHPLWNSPTEAELIKGDVAIKIANSIKNKSKRESLYIDAIAAFYKNWNKTDHHSRCINFEKAMENLSNTFPGDKEAAIFYALSLVASAEPNDKKFINQKKAGAILNSIYPAEPNHPGVVHYIIHTYDYPGLATLALPAARKYAQVAPSSAHALHMPSHIFTRLGLWDECIETNIRSVSSAQCYAEQAGIKGHWDEELHGLDYLVYAYLQKGENDSAKKYADYLESIDDVYPINFKVAYAFAAVPSRILLENKRWQEAAMLQVHPANFPWEDYPWQESIVHFTRLLGAVHLAKIKDADNELARLAVLHATLEKQKDDYKSHQVAIQIKTGEAWIKLAIGKSSEALDLMRLAANMEYKTGKHPVTPGEVLPARELLGDMFFHLGKFDSALVAYETVLENSPNRFNSLYSAGLSAEMCRDKQKATDYYQQLLAITNNAKSGRNELANIHKYLAAQ